MRINRYIALATGLSRRAADLAISDGRVEINDSSVSAGHQVEPSDTVTLDGHPITVATTYVTIALNKPPGYVCSRNGQGSKTIYDLLPTELHNLKPVGRLDKDSSGLLLLTNDGQLAQRLTHPSFEKQKIYEIKLNKSLKPEDAIKIAQGIELEDGISKLNLKPVSGEHILVPNSYFLVSMTEGRNRQIRRTFAALGYKVTGLHRTQFGDYQLDGLPSGKYKNS